MLSKKWIAHASLLFVTLIWGATFVVVQHAISLVQPFTFNAIRFLIAGLILLIIQIIYTKRVTVSISRKDIVSGALIGFFLFGGYLFQTFGLLYTTSSKAGFLTGLSIVMIPIFSYIFLKQKTGLFAIIGILTATAGLFLLTAENSFRLNQGDILVLCCAVSFALHILINGAYAHTLSPLFLSTVQILTVGTLSTICAIIFEDWERALSNDLWQNHSFLFALFLTSVFATALAFFIQTAAQKSISPTKVAMILVTEPVFAALTAMIVDNEQLSSTTIIGCVCIFLGMILVELPNKQKEESAQAA